MVWEESKRTALVNNCSRDQSVTMAMVLGGFPNVPLGANYSIITHQASTLSYIDTTYISFSENPINLTEVEVVVDRCRQTLPHAYYDTWRDMKFWSLAFIIPTGLVFNFISLGVFMTSWMRHVVPGRYFMGLALADNLVLIGELLLWLNTRDLHRGSKLGFDFHHSVDFFCKFINFLRYGARMWSSWLTVAITIERFLSVIFPFKIMRLSSPNKAVAVVTTLGLICFSLACFPFFTLEAKPYHGSPLCQYSNRLRYSVWLVVVVALIGEMVVPSVIVTIFTLLIIWKLAIARRERLRMRMRPGNDRKCGRRPKSSELQPTIALVAIAIVFVSIRMPYVIMFFINEYKKVIWTCIDKWLSYKIYVIYSMSMVLAVLNYAVNFCLYCVTGNTFRTEVRRCMFHRVPNYIIPRTRSNVTVYRGRDSVYGRDSVFSRGNSSPIASCPAAVPPITWNIRRGSSDPDLSEAFQMREMKTAEEYLRRSQKQTTIPQSPPLWSERSRQPSKTFIVRDGDRYLELDKSKLRPSHSEEHLGARALEQVSVTYGAIDEPGRRPTEPAETRVIKKAAQGMRKRSDLCQLQGCYNAKTQTVIIISDSSPCRRKKTKNKKWNCFSTSDREVANFC